MFSNWKVRLGALSVIGLIIFGPMLAHFKLKLALAAYQKQLARQGEKMTVAELTPAVSADEIASEKELCDAALQLGSPYDFVRKVQSLGPGRAIGTWRQWNYSGGDPPPTNMWPAAESWLETNRQALAALRDILKHPAGQSCLDYSLGFQLPLPDLLPRRQAIAGLSSACIAELRAHHAQDACEDLKACIALTAWDAKTPVLASRRQGLVAAEWALNTTWEAWQCPDWTEREWASLQRAWESVDLTDGMDACLAMQRAVADVG
jgi:hypothetical protein